MYWMILSHIWLFSTSSAQIFDTTTMNEFSTIVCTDTDCIVICDTLNGCSEATIDAHQSDTLTLTCSNTNSCDDLTIVSAAQISTNIYCSGLDSCEHSVFNVGNSTSVTINCTVTNSTLASIHNGACSYTDLNAQESNSLNIGCYGDWSCYDMDIYCPLSENGECNFDCGSSDGDNSCSHMSVFIPDTNNIDIQCGTLHWETCWQTDIYCGTNTSAPHSMLHHISDEIGYGCTAGLKDECCPFYDGTLDCNGQGEACDIDCTGTDCVNHIIDGSTALETFTVNCGPGGCGGAIIICPNTTACSIKCDERESCAGATIRAIYSHSVSLTCLDSFSCEEMNIWAMYANDLTIYSEGLFGLYHADIHADYANTINVVCHTMHSMEACGWVNIFASYANSITLDASDEQAFSYSNLYAQHADSVSLTCSSRMGENGCYRSDFYIPDNGRNTIFNCYGSGCQYIGDIYVDSSISLLTLNVNACDQCDSLSHCTEPFTFNCEPLNQYSYNQVISLTNCSTSSSYYCGCNTFANRISFQHNTYGSYENCILETSCECGEDRSCDIGYDCKCPVGCIEQEETSCECDEDRSCDIGYFCKCPVGCIQQEETGNCNQQTPLILGLTLVYAIQIGIQI